MEVFIPGHDPVDLTEENGLVITDELALPIEVYPGNKDAINMNSHVEFARDPVRLHFVYSRGRAERDL